LRRAEPISRRDSEGDTEAQLLTAHAHSTPRPGASPNRWKGPSRPAVDVGEKAQHRANRNRYERPV
jgi:hypothetical protein